MFGSECKGAHRDHRRSRLVVVSGSSLLALATACGGGSQSNPPPTVTSGYVNAPSGETSATVAQLENERDSARREAAQAQQRAQNDERQLAVDERALAGVRERDSFNRDVSAKLDKIESEIRSVQAHLVRASAAERAKVERTLHDLAARREYVERDLLRSRDVSESDWRNYALGIDSRVDAMELELRSLEAGR